MENLIKKKHHQQEKFCTTRPKYRQGKNLTSVKVYTVNNESQHLFIYGVPSINLKAELRAMCVRYGQILNMRVVNNHETEMFTECYHVQYEYIQSARIAKRFLDNRSFYGGLLHVCYAPEYETLEETKKKLFQRNKDVLVRLLPDKLSHKFDTYKRHIAVKEKKSFEQVPMDPLLVNNVPVLNNTPHKNSNLKLKMLEFQSVTDHNEKLPGVGANKVQDKCGTTLIPTQVTRKSDTVKRIVFKKRKLCAV